MNVTVSQDAQKWFEDELGISKNTGVRFFGKYGGSTPVHDGFSIGVEVNEPENTLTEFKGETGVLYYIDEADEWFFKGFNLVVQYDKDKKEPNFIYEANDEL